VFDAHHNVLEDEIIRKRIHHIYQAQKAFLLICQKKVLDRQLLAEIQNMSVLKNKIEANHKEAVEFIKNISDEQLKGMVNIPWFKDPPMNITVEQALMQAAMHSQHHRGQNATRMRELGIEPPLTDYIVWLWKK
jgi:uncharacterized damage-inducible protein DinB